MKVFFPCLKKILLQLFESIFSLSEKNTFATFRRSIFSMSEKNTFQLFASIFSLSEKNTFHLFFYFRGPRDPPAAKISIFTLRHQPRREKIHFSATLLAAWRGGARPARPGARPARRPARGPCGALGGPWRAPGSRAAGRRSAPRPACPAGRRGQKLGGGRARVSPALTW